MFVFIISEIKNQKNSLKGVQAAEWVWKPLTFSIAGKGPESRHVQLSAPILPSVCTPSCATCNLSPE